MSIAENCSSRQLVSAVAVVMRETCVRVSVRVRVRVRV
jgi:hypothetical protein